MGSFIDTLKNIDKDVLLFINGHHAPWADSFFWLVSERLTWIPLYILFAILIFRDYHRTSWIIYIFAALAILLSDQGSNLIKEQVMRLRPSHTPGLSNMLHYYNSNGSDYTGGDYGFVSNHAANAAAFAAYIILLFRNRFVSLFLFLFVCIICYSRVYLGVHYPSDVICGAIFGMICGSFAHHVCQLIQRGTSLWDT